MLLIGIKQKTLSVKQQFDVC